MKGECPLKIKGGHVNSNDLKANSARNDHYIVGYSWESGASSWRQLVWSVLVTPLIVSALESGYVSDQNGAFSKADFSGLW